MNGIYDLIDGVYIQKSYKVKTESINMIFICPVIYRFHNVLLDHGTLGSSIVATAGAVGIASV